VEFSPATAAWFNKTFSAPTPAQTQGWEAIGRGDHTLILAPTGSGKTLAAFLWALDRVLNQPPRRGCRVLYVSPLKALTYDIARNLEEPLAGITGEADALDIELSPVRIGVRTGDTAGSERRRMARLPPEILATTPESLYLLLTSRAKEMLETVEHVIVDEIHAVASTKRGSHLALSLERLEELAASPPQRIGLSATQRPLEEVARFLGGQELLESGHYQPRPVTIVNAGQRKDLDLRILSPSDPEPAGESPEGSVWPAVYPLLLDLIAAHRSTLIFVNSRRLAERLAARLNELAGAGPHLFAEGASAYLGAGAPAELVRAHHGSLARDQREEIEGALKGGQLPALVATSSLELGIDMGAIDLVVQVEAPVSVSSGLQRVGRAGHHVDAPSKGRVIPKFPHDLLVGAAVVERMKAALVEETRVPVNTLDVLAQQIVASVAAAGTPVAVEDLLHLVRRAYPFRDLSDGAFEGVLDMLSGKYPSDEYADLRPRLVWDRTAGTVQSRPGSSTLAVISGGTIPDRGLYGVYTSEGSRVGELDEEMVYETRVGDTFLLGATTWRILEITRDRVIVAPAPGVPGRMPFWHGDSPGRPYELGEAIGRFTRTLSERSDAELADRCGLDGDSLAALRAYVDEEMQATGGLLPTDKQLVVERFRDDLGDWRVAVLSPFGARVHAPWALAVEAKLAVEVSVESRVLWSDDGLILRVPEADRPPPLESILVDPDEVEKLVVDALAGSALFATRFRDNAARSLLLPRRRPGSRTPLWLLRQRASDLLQVAARHPSFPIVLETYRECMQDVFDLPALTRLLGDIRAGRVGVASVDVDIPSPFASGLVFAYVAQFMYDGDAPLAERRAQALTLDRRMLADLLGTDELADLLDVEVLDAVEADLQATDAGRRAATVEEVADLLRRIGDLTGGELAMRCTTAEFAGVAMHELTASGRALSLDVAGDQRLVIVEDAARYRDALGVTLPEGLPPALLEPEPDALLQLVRRWARTHGPFTVDQLAGRFGLEPATAAAILDRLLASGRVARGRFRPGAARSEEWCDSEVLRRLRQRSLAILRREVEPVDSAVLPAFLLRWHAVAGVGETPRGRRAEGVLDALSRLEGFPLPASVLEADYLPTRVAGYTPQLLDELLAAGEIMWVGAGSLGRRDGRIALARRDRAGTLLPRFGLEGSPDPDLKSELHRHIRLVLDERGACFFREMGRPATNDAALLEALWDLVWAGEVTCDGLGALRARASGSRRRESITKIRPVLPRAAGPSAGQGRWSLVRRELAASLAGDSEAALAASQALLDRHGVLTRHAVAAESVPGGFAAVYPVLRALEDSGRIRRGYFIEGLGGAQFARPGAVDLLRAARNRGSAAVPSVHVVAATDPANPFGAALPWPVKGPARTAGAHIVLVDGMASAYLERSGRALTMLRQLDGTWEEPLAFALASQVTEGRWRRLLISRWPEELAPSLEAAGFVPGPKGFVRYR
jgi:ATP-dependent Lhr-like helicase